MTRHAEVIGDPIAHSRSPIIHRFWLEALGIAGDYRRHHVRPDELASYIATARAEAGWLGCNVTVPHKQAVMPLLDVFDPRAAAIGAVNTIVRQSDGALRGYNTDAEGFLEPLRPMLARPHLFRMARILGAGGAARAIVAALAEQGFTLVVAARDPAKARALLDELAPGGAHHAVPLATFAVPTAFAFDDRRGCLDLVVNATSLGMAGQPPLAFDMSHAPPGAFVYDIVYSPLETPLLAAARARGLPVIDGLEMLIGQAATAFRLLFGVDAPRARDAELRVLLTA
ncbi:MAG TPA: shikimate dehydrogenase [Sphingomonas sp.]